MLNRIRALAGKCVSVARVSVRSVVRVACTAVLGVGLAVGAANVSFATGVTLPEIDVDFPGLVTAAGARFAPIVIAVGGLFVAILCAKKGFSFLRSYFG